MNVQPACRQAGVQQGMSNVQVNVNSYVNGYVNGGQSRCPADHIEPCSSEHWTEISTWQRPGDMPLVVAVKP